MSPRSAPNLRILLVDDNTAIHVDFQRILAPRDTADDLEAEAASLFGGGARFSAAPAGPQFELHSAYQGQEGYAKVKAALEADRPYALAFVDMRMPPGWDGLETIGHLWEIDPELQIVICTAQSDHSWEHIQETLRARDRWLVLKKPFDKVEVLQLAHVLTDKWQLNRDARTQRATLERRVAERTQRLELSLKSQTDTLEGITDDLGAPIAGILAALDRLGDSELTSGQRASLEIAQQSGQHLQARLRHLQASTHPAVHP